MKKIVKILIILTLIFGAGIFLGIKIESISTQKEERLKKERFFYQKLEEFKKSGGKEILIKELTNFEWDNVCYVWPYGGLDEEFRSVKLDREIPEDDNDGKFGIVFIKKENGVVFRVSRKDFTVEEKICSNRSGAALKLNNK